MIAMSNLEEFAKAVGRDVKRFETDYTSKAELEAKDYIEGKSDYQILKHQVEELTKQNKAFQEQLALIKPAPRRAPMAYTIDLNSTPPVAWFDNGCGLDTGGNPVLLGKTYYKPWNQESPFWDFPNAILRTSLAIIDIDIWKKANFDYWHDVVKVLNPLKSADDYDWTRARLTERGSMYEYQWNNQKNIIRVMYQLGIWDAKTVESLGAVRR